MGCGQVVRRLTLDQEIVGSNPTIPAITTFVLINVYRILKLSSLPVHLE